MINIHAGTAGGRHYSLIGPRDNTFVSHVNGYDVHYVQVTLKLIHSTALFPLKDTPLGHLYQQPPQSTTGCSSTCRNFSNPCRFCSVSAKLICSL